MCVWGEDWARCWGAGSHADSVGSHGVPDPLGETAEFGVDTRSVGLSTGKVSPGHQALEGAVADYRAPRVTLQSGGNTDGGGNTETWVRKGREGGRYKGRNISTGLWVQPVAGPH